MSICFVSCCCPRVIWIPRRFMVHLTLSVGCGHEAERQGSAFTLLLFVDGGVCLTLESRSQKLWDAGLSLGFPDAMHSFLDSWPRPRPAPGSLPAVLILGLRDPFLLEWPVKAPERPCEETVALRDPVRRLWALRDPVRRLQAVRSSPSLLYYGGGFPVICKAVSQLQLERVTFLSTFN